MFLFERSGRSGAHRMILYRYLTETGKLTAIQRIRSQVAHRKGKTIWSSGKFFYKQSTGAGKTYRIIGRFSASRIQKEKRCSFCRKNRKIPPTEWPRERAKVEDNLYFFLTIRRKRCRFVKVFFENLIIFLQENCFPYLLLDYNCLLTGSFLEIGKKISPPENRRGKALNLLVLETVGNCVFPGLAIYLLCIVMRSNDHM